MFAWLFGSETKAPIFLKFRSSKTFIIVTVASSIFTDSELATISRRTEAARRLTGFNSLRIWHRCTR